MAVFEDLAGPGKEGDGVVEFPEDLAEDFLQFMEGGMRDVFFIEAFVRKVEFLPKGLAIEGGLAVGGEDTVGGFQDGGEVVDEGAGPVEDEIADQDKGLRG